MSLQQIKITSMLRAALLLSLIIGVFLLFRGVFPGLSPVSQTLAAVQRLFEVALADTSELGWLVLVCIAAGILVMADRRRRAKARQASS